MDFLAAGRDTASFQIDAIASAFIDERRPVLAGSEGLGRLELQTDAYQEQLEMAPFQMTHQFELGPEDVQMKGADDADITMPGKQFQGLFTMPETIKYLDGNQPKESEA